MESKFKSLRNFLFKFVCCLVTPFTFTNRKFSICPETWKELACFQKVLNETKNYMIHA